METVLAALGTFFCGFLGWSMAYFTWRSFKSERKDINKRMQQEEKNKTKVVERKCICIELLEISFRKKKNIVHRTSNRYLHKSS